MESFLVMDCLPSLRPTVFVSQAEEGTGLALGEPGVKEGIRMAQEGILQMELSQIPEEDRQEEDLEFNYLDKCRTVGVGVETEEEQVGGLEEEKVGLDLEEEEDRASSVVPTGQRLDLESHPWEQPKMVDEPSSEQTIILEELLINFIPLGDSSDGRPPQMPRLPQVD